MSLTTWLVGLHPGWQFIIGHGAVFVPYLVIPGFAWLRGKTSRFPLARRILRIPEPEAPKALTPEEEKRSETPHACPRCRHEFNAVCRQCTVFVTDANVTTLLHDYFTDPNALLYELRKFARHMPRETLAVALHGLHLRTPGGDIELRIGDEPAAPDVDLKGVPTAVTVHAATNGHSANGNGNSKHDPRKQVAPAGGTTRRAAKPPRRDAPMQRIEDLPVQAPPDEPEHESYGRREDGGLE